MTRRKMSVAELAAEAGVDVDEALLRLWDDGFSAATSREYVFPKRETNRARRTLELPTRRALQSQQYWTQALGLSSEQELDTLLRHDLHIGRPVDGRRLRAQAIHRLQAERRRRALVQQEQPRASTPARRPRPVRALKMDTSGAPM